MSTPPYVRSRAQRSTDLHERAVFNAYLGMLDASRKEEDRLLFYAASDLAEKVRYRKTFRNSCSTSMALEAIWKLARFLNGQNNNAAARGYAVAAKEI